jgi:hypothetical protein
MAPSIHASGIAQQIVMIKTAGAAIRRAEAREGFAAVVGSDTAMEALGKEPTAWLIENSS